MIKRTRVHAVLALSLYAGCAPGIIDDANLFTEEQVEDAESTGQVALVGLRTAVLQSEAADRMLAGETVQFNAFDQSLVLGGFAHSSQGLDTEVIHTGEVDSQLEVSFVYRDQTLESGLIQDHTGSTSYVILPADEPGRYRIEKYDLAAFPPGGEPLVPDGSAPPTSPEPQFDIAAATAANPAQIDVMIMWTAAAQGGSSVATMKALANQAIATSNQAYLNSGIHMHLNLVYSGLAAGYVESSNFSSIFDSFRNTYDGKMDEMATLREAYHADMVSLLVANNSLCGMGNLPGALLSIFINHYVSAVNRSCAVGNLSFPHELGHNMGAQHDRAKSSENSPLFPYSYGWKWTGVSGTKYRDIMSYGSEQRPLRFSNPNVLHDGKPTGVPAGQTNAADIALTFNQSGPFIAQLRSGGTGSGGTGSGGPTTEVIPPTVALTSPLSGATLSSIVSLQATATDASGVARVEFFVDAKLVGQDTASPYGISYSTTQVANGVHTFSAKAFDTKGNFASTAPRSVTIQNGTTTTLGTPTLFLPANNATGVTFASTTGNWVRWWSLAGAASYDIYHGTANPPPKVGTILANQNPSRYPGARYFGVIRNPGTRYYWRIVARNAAGTTTTSPTWTYQMQ